MFPIKTTCGLLFFALFMLRFGAVQALGQSGPAITDPQALNTDADSDAPINDGNPQLATDEAGIWVATWTKGNLGLTFIIPIA